MEPHGIYPRDGRKEITCSDCGHRYVIAQGQRSGHCQLCGNIEFLGDNMVTLSREIVAKRILPRLQENRSAPDPLAPFREASSGEQVEEVRMRFQVEWQLWSAVVKRFNDPVYHIAYITQATVAGELDRAAERYREHRSVMTLLADSRWQAEVADLMLTRVEMFAHSRMVNEKIGHGFMLPEWALLAPFQGNIVRVLWIALGLFAVARLLHLHP